MVRFQRINISAVMIKHSDMLDPSALSEQGTLLTRKDGLVDEDRSYYGYHYAKYPLLHTAGFEIAFEISDY